MSTLTRVEAIISDQILHNQDAVDIEDFDMFILGNNFYNVQIDSVDITDNEVICSVEELKTVIDRINKKYFIVDGFILNIQNFSFLNKELEIKTPSFLKKEKTGAIVFCEFRNRYARLMSDKQLILFDDYYLGVNELRDLVLGLQIQLNNRRIRYTNIK